MLRDTLTLTSRALPQLSKGVRGSLGPHRQEAQGRQVDARRPSRHHPSRLPLRLRRPLCPRSQGSPGEGQVFRPCSTTGSTAVRRFRRSSFSRRLSPGSGRPPSIDSSAGFPNRPSRVASLHACRPPPSCVHVDCHHPGRFRTPSQQSATAFRSTDPRPCPCRPHLHVVVHVGRGECG
jgi:hypothetical protein